MQAGLDTFQDLFQSQPVIAFAPAESISCMSILDTKKGLSFHMPLIMIYVYSKTK
jgi:hypothetical protein